MMEHKATAPPPPPPPPPPSCGKQPCGISPPPCPGHAAIPFSSNDPVQETSPSPEALHHAEDAPAPLLPVQNGPPSPPSQEDNPSDSEEKYAPVQETDPAPQMIEQQDEAAIQTDQAEEDQLPLVTERATCRLETPVNQCVGK